MFKRMAMRWVAGFIARALAGEVSHARVMGLVRHGLTSLGGILAARGIIDAGAWEAISGILLTAFGVAWSMVAKPTQTA